MIDLHIHTTCSDGLKTPNEVLDQARDLKLNAISITDHNSVEAYKQIGSNHSYRGLIIKGCELTCMINKLCIELLAYQFNPQSIEEFIKSVYLPFPQMNVLETNMVIDTLSKTPLIMDRGSITYDVENEYGNRGVHREIVKHEENRQFIDEMAWNDPHEFSLRYLSNENSPFYVDYSPLVPNYMNVINAIRNANGLVFMPHIFKYRDSLDTINEGIIKQGLLDGIECYHSSFSDDDVKTALEIAKENKLYISGGSDTHGYDEEDEVKLGVGYGNMAIPDEIIKPWVRELKR